MTGGVIMNKSLQVKKNHHHVWANYMKQWSPDSDRKRVYFTTKVNRNIRFDSIRNIAVERAFYRVQPLTSEHVKLIKAWSLKSPKELHELHMSYLKEYMRMQFLESLYKEIGEANELADQMLEAFKNNSVENLHSAHEGEVQDILISLVNRNISILKEGNNMAFFMGFMGQQIARTKNFRDLMAEIYSGILDSSKKEQASYISKLIQECWWFISYMLGMNIGQSLYSCKDDDNHCLLINNTDKSFITSDQPIINVHQALNNEITPPKDHECDFYYPISPNIAYMINKSNRFPSGEVQVSADFVDEVNVKIAKRANFHIIGNSEGALKPYKKYVGSHLYSVRNTNFFSQKK